MFSITTKILSILSLLLFVYSSITTTLYLSTKSSLKQLESQYTIVKSTLDQCNASRDKIVLSNIQDDKISVEKQDAINKIDSAKKTNIDKLNSIPKTNTCKPVGNINEGHSESSSDSVDIDGKLSPDLIDALRVLPSNYQGNKGSSSTSSR